MASLEMKRWAKIGTRIHVEWLDITGCTNTQLSSAEPLPCWSEGLLVKNTKGHVVVTSSQYCGEGDDPVGDYTAIPKGVGLKVTHL
tara:strand:- start:189 stop:446 length:258 start_codon:yes stop_codon:yes gene_type:complete